jgi:hypothetical protein
MDIQNEMLGSGGRGRGPASCWGRRGVGVRSSIGSPCAFSCLLAAVQSTLYGCHVRGPISRHHQQLSIAVLPRATDRRRSQQLGHSFCQKQEFSNKAIRQEHEQGSVNYNLLARSKENTLWKTYI